jgi:hypothetical protein
MIQREAVSRDHVALEHMHEISVQPFTGEKAKGDEHALLRYSHDLRKDLPDGFRGRVAKTMPGRAVGIGCGWMARSLLGSAASRALYPVICPDLRPRFGFPGNAGGCYRLRPRP